MRILAHRGCPGPSTSENTVAAVSAALAAGADGVEVDLRLTSDGVLAACHDPDLTRVAGSPLEVGTTAWTTLRRAAAAGGVRLARVEELLTATAGRATVLELKSSGAPARLVAQVLVDRLRVLHDAGLPLQVTVSSFDPELVGAFRQLAPSRLAAATALLGRPGCLPLAVVRQARLAGHSQVHPHVTDLLQDPHTVAAARAVGIQVVPWTVNSRRTVRRCADLGIGALITDRPRIASMAARPLSAAA